jgi:3-hydroxy acid dehydrogenase/malonic semialdehyde reductase
MVALRDQVVFITGASSGIGAACARAFAREGARLLLAARRGERLDAMERGLRDAGATGVHRVVLDVRERERVFEAVDRLSDEWKAIEVLVNNAGLSRGLDKLHEGDLQDWEEMIDTNVKGLLYVDRAVVPLMVERGRGTVVHIGSVAGRQLYPGGNVYCASKHAVRAITEGLRIDLLGTGVRVTSVDPGLVETEFSVVRFHGDAERASGVYRGMTPLTGDDVADVVLFATTRPPHVDIAEVLLFPTDQAGSTYVYRREGRTR